MRILLMRHAPSTWNIQHRFQGRADPPLAECAVEEIRVAALELPRVGAIVSSPLGRAAETARYLATLQKLPLPTLDSLWQERDVGQWEGLTRADVEAGWPGYLERGERPEGWETDAHVVERADEAGRRLARREFGAPILVVTHSAIIRSLERREGAADAPIENLTGRWAFASEDGVSLTGEGWRSC